MLKSFHVALALLSVTGFVIRLGWAYVAPHLNRDRWVRVAPHVVDSGLLLLGLMLAFSLQGPWPGWLTAKLCALLAYIGFGALALRGTGLRRHLGALGALCAVGYIFVVAVSRQWWPGG